MFYLPFFCFLLLCFPNSIFFTIFLLFLVIFIVCLLVSSGLIAPLTSLILLLVYVGAIIVLIGYICAISPNLILYPFFISTLMPLFATVILILHSDFMISNSITFPPLSFIYSSNLYVFCSLVFMLFITLLIVTAQYSNPKGPIRSING